MGYGSNPTSRGGGGGASVFGGGSLFVGGGGGGSGWTAPGQEHAYTFADAQIVAHDDSGAEYTIPLDRTVVIGMDYEYGFEYIAPNEAYRFRNPDRMRVDYVHVQPLRDSEHWMHIVVAPTGDPEPEWCDCGRH